MGKEMTDFQEPLNRLRREVEKALPYWKENGFSADGLVFNLIHSDCEVKPEIENLIHQIIEDIENE